MSISTETTKTEIQNENRKSMHFSLSLVVNNVDLLSCILEFIDPQYLDVFTVNIVKEYRYYYGIVMLLTFRSLYHEYIVNSSDISCKPMSIRGSYVSSLSLCYWSVRMGIDTCLF